MNDIDTTVRESLQERAAAVRVPPAPSGAVLVTRARRAQVRRRVGAGAAAVAAAVSVFALVPHGTSSLAPPRPAGSSPATTMPESFRAARSAAVDWAARLPSATVQAATGWPFTRRDGDRLSVRVDGKNVLLPAGFTDLTEPHPVAGGWLFVASGTSVGRSALVHVDRDGWKILARPAGPTPLLVDPQGRRVAMLMVEDQSSLMIIDITTGAISGVGVPSTLKHPALASWTPLGPSIIDVGTDQPASPSETTSANGDTTGVAVFDTQTGSWVEHAASLKARVEGLVRLDTFGGSPTSPLVRTQQGSQVCVSRLSPALTLVPLECWPRSSGGRPTAVVAPGGRYALIGAAGVDGQGVTLHDLRTGRLVPGTPPQALAAGIGSYLWTGPDTFAAVAEPLGATPRGVPFRYDIGSRRGERLAEDPRSILERTYAPGRTGLTLPDGVGG